MEPPHSSVQENGCIFSIVDSNNQNSDAKRRRRKLGKLRKCGFNAHDISRDQMISLDEEGFAPIEKDQLATVKVEWEIDKNQELLQPIKSFSDLKLDDKIARNVKHYYKNPLPVQRYVIPYIQHTTADLIVRAQTAAGKTLSFLLPIIYEVYELKQGNNQAANRNSPYAVIVAPTHESVRQIATDAARLCDGVLAVRVAYAHGQLDMRDSKQMLDKGCDLLVITAGRLHHYFKEEKESKGSMLKTLNVRYVVLDEADRLLEQKPNSKEKSQELDSAEIVKTFVDRLTCERSDQFRVLMFSATYKSMKMVQKLVVWENCVNISVGSHQPPETVHQSIIEVKRTEAKMTMLLDLLNMLADESVDQSGSLRIEKTLIFVDDIRVSDRIAASLLDSSFNALSINGERSGRQRHYAMEAFQKGELDILVSTDVLARGVNINELKYVINFDIPRNIGMSELPHRIGRCGRVGNEGRAITFYDSKTDKHALQELQKLDSTFILNPDFNL